MAERAFLVDIGYACFGIVSHNSIVTDAPPIAKWMVGKALHEIKPWLLSKRARVLECRASPQ